MSLEQLIREIVREEAAQMIAEQVRATSSLPISVGEFCKAIGISRRTESRWRAQGKITRFCQNGKVVFYKREHVEAFLSDCEQVNVRRRR